MTLYMSDGYQKSYQGSINNPERFWDEAARGMGFVVLKSGVDRDQDKIVVDLIQMVRDNIGAVASFRKALIVSRLPKTRSGKILRTTLRKIASGEEFKVPSTVDDESTLVEIMASIKKMQSRTQL